MTESASTTVPEQLEQSQSQPPANGAEQPKISWLTELLERTDDPRSAESVNYGLNRQRTIISHSSAALRESELRHHELGIVRQMVADRIKRGIGELQDIDAARAALKLAIDAEHARFQGQR